MPTPNTSSPQPLSAKLNLRIVSTAAGCLLALGAMSWTPTAHARRPFDESEGFVDPRRAPWPRPHRFRLALRSHWISLVNRKTESGAKSVTFHHAPLMLDLGYQYQFLKYFMLRPAMAVGVNVANTRVSMPITLQPQAFTGYQGRILGVAMGYGYLVSTIDPSLKDNTSVGRDPAPSPILDHGHVVRGEISLTSRIDHVALTFALGGGMTKSTLRYGEVESPGWRAIIDFQFGVFFDGSRRRSKKKQEQKTSPFG